MKGHGGRFQKSLSESAKTYLITWNGRLALKFITGQPQKTVSAATFTFSACAGLMSRAQGACHYLGSPDFIGIAALRKRPPWPFNPIISFKELKS